MRRTIWSEDFSAFYGSLQPYVKEKADYVLGIISDMKILSSKIVKKLVKTEFYELRISFGQEYRVIVLPLDNENIIEAEIILLLNGFVKKSTKDYRKQISIAKNTLKQLEK
ncbi:MAG: type II toxin-antitoxin system RelE/ParE family toxin [Bacteroidales bacterium]|nr:type II toxin-antitoxin system RelE/ParE family toxin [Bacteroidales bacterium]